MSSSYVDLRVRELTVDRVDDLLDHWKTKDAPGPIVSLLLSLCENCMWLIKDWPGSPPDDVESVRRSRLAALDRLVQLSKNKFERNSDMQSIIVHLSNALRTICEQWPGNGQSSSDIRDSLPSSSNAPLIPSSSSPALLPAFIQQQPKKRKREHSEAVVELFMPKTETDETLDARNDSIEETTDEWNGEIVKEEEPLAYSSFDLEESSMDGIPGEDQLEMRQEFDDEPSSSRRSMEDPDETPTKKRTKFHSWTSIWDFFERVDEGKARFGICMRCRLKVELYLTKTAKLFTHLKTCDPDQYQVLQEQKEEMAPNPSVRIMEHFDEVTVANERNVQCKRCEYKLRGKRRYDRMSAHLEEKHNLRIV